MLIALLTQVAYFILLQIIRFCGTLMCVSHYYHVIIRSFRIMIYFKCIRQTFTHTYRDAKEVKKSGCKIVLDDAGFNPAYRGFGETGHLFAEPETAESSGSAQG